MFNEDNAYLRAKIKRGSKKFFSYAILVIISIIWMIPFIYLLAQSFGKGYNQKYFFPIEYTFDNYIRLFNDKDYNFFGWFFTTLLIALITSVTQTLITLMTSYALSRIRFNMKKPLMKMLLIIGMFPGFLGIIATYYILKLLNLSTSIFSLIILYTAGAGMGYYISKGFFDTVSYSLDEAAMIDGANKNTIFFRVIMPLSKPIIVYTVLMAFTAPWGDYMTASYLAAGNPKMFTVAVGLYEILNKRNFTEYLNYFCAGAVVTSLPIIVIFFVLQRYYVEGVTGGAVKG